MEPEFASEDFLFSCSLGGGGGRYFSVSQALLPRTKKNH